MQRSALFNIKGQLVTVFLLLIILVTVVGCATGSQCQTSGKELSAAPPLLKFQKTPCYGPCPSYEAAIMEDGTITYVGWEHVTVEDTLQTYLSKRELKQLKADISTLDYTSMQNSYLTDWTDMPFTYLTFYENGKEVKRIKHQKGGPEKLQQFKESLNDKILSLVKQKSQKQ
ncbi:DUF6438 domain-containing protein [Pontibacter locisalis]|uniref:DUF6438 domain-containing protein n=1 Tax=Pontibacter locisalis TaxID=1719035 RepID=A0ABW5IFI8_9BACT